MPMRVGGVWREEGVTRVGCGDGCPPFHWGRVWEDAVPTPQKKIECASHIGEFWCKLSAFCIVQINHVKLV